MTMLRKNMLQDNFILNTDSYKPSMFNQYPAGTEVIYSYVEARGGEYPKTLFFGLQAYLREYLSKPITQYMIDQAAEFNAAHGIPFNREGWEYILKTHEGRLPLKVSALAEGTVVEVGTPLVTIYNTDPKCAWLVTLVETSLLRAIWYGTTVATNSWTSKQVIKKYLEKNGTPEAIDFKLHDFGARGVSSFESAILGGMAHLVNFKGTDTMSGIIGAMDYYDSDMVGFSIPAMEHSTVTSWGRDNEVEAYRNMLKQYGKPGALLACVSDSYDIFAACEKWGTELKQEVIDSGATVVIRPDSGDPTTVVLNVVLTLERFFGSVKNAKKYKVLNNVRVIQGDGINTKSIESILATLDAAGFSADNVAFGQGGALLQQVNRDTCKFALKCSAARINGEWVDVFKDPVTDHGKRSKRGRFDLPREVFRDGYLYNEMTFEEVRKNTNMG